MLTPVLSLVIYCIIFLAPKTADDWIWSLIRKKLDTLEEAGLGNSASHVTTETYAGKAEEVEESDDWDDDDAFLECLSQNETAKNEPECSKENENIEVRVRQVAPFLSGK